MRHRIDSNAFRDPAEKTRSECSQKFTRRIEDLDLERLFYGDENIAVRRRLIGEKIGCDDVEAGRVDRDVIEAERHARLACKDACRSKELKPALVGVLRPCHRQVAARRIDRHAPGNSN